MGILKRNENGKLSLTHYLDLEILFGDLFLDCETETEIKWLNTNLEEALEITYEERLVELEVD